MASARYTIGLKPEDLQPDAPQAPLTRKQKWDNFWFYYKWYVLAAAVVLGLVAFTIHDAASRIQPDIHVAVIGRLPLPVPATDALADALEQQGLIPDLNGDGRCEAFVEQYVLSLDGSEALDYNVQMADSVKLMADLQDATSLIFLVDDLDSLREYTGTFIEADGSRIVPLADCSPLLKDIPLPLSLGGDSTVPVSEMLEGFTLLYRGLNDTPMIEKEEILARLPAEQALFEALAGVRP